MVKAKTLRGRKKSSENMPKLRLKKALSYPSTSLSKALLDEKLIAQAFWECLKDNDPEGAMQVISAHLDALNIAVPLSHFKTQKSQFSLDNFS